MNRKPRGPDWWRMMVGRQAASEAASFARAIQQETMTIDEAFHAIAVEPRLQAAVTDLGPAVLPFRAAVAASLTRFLAQGISRRYREPPGHRVTGRAGDHAGQGGRTATHALASRR